MRQLNVPVTLVVGGTMELIKAVGQAALTAQVLVAECSVADVATTAAQMRPLVIVLPEHVYQFDAESFEALAIDVRSRLLRVSEDQLDQDQLQRDLLSLMLEAERERPSWVAEF